MCARCSIKMYTASPNLPLENPKIKFFPQDSPFPPNFWKKELRSHEINQLSRFSSPFCCCCCCRHHHGKSMEILLLAQVLNMISVKQAASIQSQYCRRRELIEFRLVCLSWMCFPCCSSQIFFPLVCLSDMWKPFERTINHNSALH